MKPFPTDTDMNRIGVSAHYTGYVWSLKRLQPEFFATAKGRLAHWLLRLPNFFMGKLFMGADIDTFLLHRHMVIDYLLEQAIHSGYTQVVELASGLSGRGFAFCDKYSNLRYIETDLPHMIFYKQKLLKKIPSYNPLRHAICPCNVLEKWAETSIEAVFQTHVDRSLKTVVISEGLVNYFSLPIISKVWQRIAVQLGFSKAGIYMTDIYPDLKNHPYYRLMNFAGKSVGFLTKGQWPLHFTSDQEMSDAFLTLGYHGVKVFDPSSFYGVIPIPKVRVPTMVRIVRAGINE